MKTVKARVSDFLRILRAMSCANQEQMSKHLDISKSNYCDIENGKQNFTVDFLERLQTFTNLDICSILSIKEPLLNSSVAVAPQSNPTDSILKSSNKEVGSMNNAT